MMIKITHKCSMNCIHCMNAATKDGEHMDFTTFATILDFQRKYGGPVCFITGGEPFEHPHFWQFLGYAMTQLPNIAFTVATNGLAFMDENNAKIIRELNEKHALVEFQVSTDKRYYPIQIDTSLDIYHLDNVVLIQEIPKLYPQGRAKTNNLPWSAIGSKCCNVRGIMKQISPQTLLNLTTTMFIYNRLCTPHIDIHGDIKLGESDLCPVCSTVFKTEQEIVDDILKFQCCQCNHVNKNLPQQMKDLLGVK